MPSAARESEVTDVCVGRGDLPEQKSTRCEAETVLPPLPAEAVDEVSREYLVPPTEPKEWHRVFPCQLVHSACPFRSRNANVMALRSCEVALP